MDKNTTQTSTEPKKEHQDDINGSTGHCGCGDNKKNKKSATNNQWA